MLLLQDADTDCGGSDTCEATETDNEAPPPPAMAVSAPSGVSKVDYSAPSGVSKVDYSAPSGVSKVDYIDPSCPIDLSINKSTLPSAYPHVPFAGGDKSMQYPGTSLACGGTDVRIPGYANMPSASVGSMPPAVPFCSYSPYSTAVPFSGASMMPGLPPVYPRPVLPSRHAMPPVSGVHPT